MTRGDRALEGDRHRRPTSRPNDRHDREPGAIDCDVHPSVPDVAALLPHLETFWRDSAVERGLNSLDSNSYPLKSPLTSRPEWRGKNGLPAADAKEVGDQVFGRWQSGTAILNCLYGVQLLFSEDMAAAFCRALNDYIAKEWLDRDPRHARLDRHPDAERRIRGRRDRALRQGQALRAGAGAGDAGGAARAAAFLADLRRLRAARPAARHPCRLRLPQSGDLARLADLVHRGLCRAGAGLPVADGEPDHRGRARQASRR